MARSQSDPVDAVSCEKSGRIWRREGESIFERVGEAQAKKFNRRVRQKLGEGAGESDKKCHCLL
jgi:hypothetical protein